ncbi:C4-dicarboxylate TRAP transporter large permease protein DctM [Roseovarius sp. EC-HK134]|uniref:TRAP transporter large permease n=1 Tax=unclassified Roseovarius TaxID=2614913 RepID=UPI0012520C61|nr:MULTISPECIES: TRAP transporter large permease [unclassified Roseovarius]VVT17571.1 C4-dicarboxylate TRAP transporter large permease protein DctM [Roseovarius sp. EC-HK134]VVT17998.1 C4-dicarboxylate TRAP transporter large permease protein DctM [Roseovarius sp. EC-SD190]
MNGPLVMAAAFVFAMAIGVPIPFAAGLATVAGLLIADIPLTLMAQAAWTAFEPFPLVTIPLFILAGQLMEQGGMSEKLVTIAKRLVGAYNGGMGLVTVVACMFFAALSGSGPATTAAIGSITIPAMQKEGYRSRFAGAIAASAGALGSMIPPSNLLIIFALVTDVSIPRLFLAGILPGLILGLMLMVVVFVISWKNGYGGTEERFRWGPLLWALWDGKWAVFAPILILGGIYAGIFTPSEAAAVAVAYGLFVGLFVYKGLTWVKLLHAFKFTAIVIGTVLFILGSTKAFGQLVTIFDIPSDILTLFQGLIAYPWLIMLFIGIFYILVGMWLESIPQIIIFTAVFFPLVTSLGIDPVVFGIFTVMTCEIGFLTPPIGVNLFVAARISKISIEDISVGVLPLLIPYILMILILVFFSDWVTWLPNLVYGPQLR